MRAPLLIHLCVVNHCGEKATFYLSEPNPDHMSTPSPAHSSSSPPLPSSFSSFFPRSPSGLHTSPTLSFLNHPFFFFLLHPHSSSASSPSSTFLSVLSAKKLPPCFLPLADFWKAIAQLCVRACVCVCVCACVCVCVLGRWGQASFPVSYNQHSRVPVMLCIVRTHH